MKGLIIRKEQIDALSKARLNRFEKNVIEHVKKIYPDQCKALGNQEVKEMVRYGIKNSAQYNISIEIHILKYIDLMFICGRDFDKIPQAYSILADPEIDPKIKLNKVLEQLL